MHEYLLNPPSEVIHDMTPFMLPILNGVMLVESCYKL